MSTDTTWTATDLATAEEAVRDAQAEVDRLRAAGAAQVTAARDVVHSEAERFAAGQRGPEDDATSAEEGQAAARARIAANPKRYGVTSSTSTPAGSSTSAGIREVKGVTSADGLTEARRRVTGR